MDKQGIRRAGTFRSCLLRFRSNFYVRMGEIYAIQAVSLSKKKGYEPDRLVTLEKSLEAAIRVELMNNGFADHCLGHLATPPCTCMSMRPFLYHMGSF